MSALQGRGPRLRDGHRVHHHPAHVDRAGTAQPRGAPSGTIQARQDALRQIDTKLTNLKLAAGDLRSAALWSPSRRYQRHRGRAHGPPGHRRGPRRLHRKRLLSGQRGLAHLCVERRRRQPQRRLQVRRRRRHHDQDLRPHGHEPGRRRLHRQQRRHVAGVGGQRRREALALAPRDRRSGHLGLRRSGRPWALDGLARRSNAAYTIAGDATTYSSHTNVATDGLPGVELTFKSIGTSTVTVSARRPTPPTCPPSSRRSSRPTTTPSTSCAAS